MGKTKYSVVGELGKGGFGVVFLLAGDNGHKLAIKTVDLRKIPEDFRERAKDEAKVLKSLTHKHLVHHVHSYIKHPHLCIITEFCAGGDLDKVVSHLGFTSGLPEKLIICWLMQTASALNYMHTHSPVVLHRDLKPQNIYVTGSGDVRLGDLGLARKLTGPQDMANTQVGTILYLSPEIIAGQPYNSKSDIWSLGCVFYDIAGKKGGDEMGAMFLLVQVMGGRKLPLPDHYSGAMRATVSSLLTKDPRQRPSAQAILASQVVQEFKRNPQKPADIIAEFAISKGRSPPTIARDLNRLKDPESSPLQPDDILVPMDAEKLLADVDREGGASPRSRPIARPLEQAMAGLNVQGISSNSMALFGGKGAVAVADGGGGAAGAACGGAQAGMSSNSLALFGDKGAVGGDGAAALGGADSAESETFYDSQVQPELGAEHLLLQIQRLQSDATSALGADILQAAYAVIANVKDQSAMVKELKGLLGEDLYNCFGAQLLRLRALEYGLHKTTGQHRQK